MQVLIVKNCEGRSWVEDSLASLGCSYETATLDELSAGLLRMLQTPPLCCVEVDELFPLTREVFALFAALRPPERVPVLAAVAPEGLSRLAPSMPFDDVVVLPCQPMELYLRLRRLEWRHDALRSACRMKLGRVFIDLTSRELFVDGQKAATTQREFDLLSFLLARRGQVFTRELLLEHVWGVRNVRKSRTVDIHIRRLRAKSPALSEVIHTIRGVGYRAGNGSDNA